MAFQLNAEYFGSFYQYHVSNLYLSNSKNIESVQKGIVILNELAKKEYEWAKLSLLTSYLDMYRKNGVTTYLGSALEIIIDLLSDNNSDVLLQISYCYRDGIIFSKNIDMAIKYAKMAAKNYVRYANEELFDLLWKKNTPESLKEMFDLAKYYAKLGNNGMMGRLARAYRYGKGTDINLNEAIKWYKLAKWKNKELDQTIQALKNGLK